MKELSLCIGRKDHKEAIVIIKTIGKSIGKIKSPHILKKTVLLKPTTTRHDSIEEQLRRMAEVNCSHRSSYSNHTGGTNISKRQQKLEVILLVFADVSFSGVVCCRMAYDCNFSVNGVLCCSPE